MPYVLLTFVLLGITLWCNEYFDWTDRVSVSAAAPHKFQVGVSINWGVCDDCDTPHKDIAIWLGWIVIDLFLGDPLNDTDEAAH